MPERVQSAYLGGLPPGHDVAATVGLWQSFRALTPAEIHAGLAGIARIAAIARRREGFEVLADLRGTVARALWRQAVWIGRRDPALTARLMAAAVRFRVAA